MEKKVQPVLWAEAVLLAVLALAALFPFVYGINLHAEDVFDGTELWPDWIES